MLQCRRGWGSGLLLLAWTGAVTSCGSCGGGSAIDATVVVPSNLDVRCADVTAVTPPNALERAGPFDASAGGTYAVAVFPGGSLGNSVTLQAHGFVGADCATLVAQSDVQIATFDGRIDTVTLTLSAPCDGGCADAGGADGSVAADGGADAGHDAGTDAGADAGTGGRPDSGTDAGPGADAGPDAGADAGSGPDGGSDAGAGPDAGCTPGQTCGTQGICTGDGICVPYFACDPGNIVRSQLPLIGPPLVLSCGLTAIDTGTSATPTLTNWCGPKPGFAQITQSNGQTALIAAMAGFVLDAGSQLIVTGSQPLILAVFGNAQIAGTLFAGADLSDGGAGSSAACSGGIGQDGTPSNRAGGGGGGGGFGVNGGSGGNPAGTGGAGGAPGQPEASASLVPLRGGCRGGAGSANTGSFGEGGGALQLSATSTLTIDGTVASPGGGGSAGPGGRGAGGGGGGSGGALLLEGQTIVLSGGASVTANGGGGGGGGGSVLAGNDGSDGLTQSAANAPGGPGNGVDSGDGGVGGAQVGAGGGADGMNVSVFWGSGGGGGGGVGRVRLHACGTCSKAAGATVSPPAGMSNCP